ncbi:hypothetical protein ACN42_g1604 [Penicillium freii]|uniref:Uncharacterized protein n=1 Tax=Penicillium freii TaxID=48697 RepID=A0A101MRN0_PENFR|nr:hypothetical protein ACN42_g1604 [Penicillium freii]
MEEGIDSMHLVLPPEPTHIEAPPASQMPQHSPLGDAAQASTSSSTWFSDSNPDSSANAAGMSSYPSIPRTMDYTPASPHVTVNQYVNASSFNRHSETTNATDAHGADFSQSILTLRGHIEEIERQLDRRVMPSMENIIRIRNQLLEIQDARPASQLPLPGVAELVARILDAQQRARLMEFMQQQHLQTGGIAQSAFVAETSVSTTLGPNSTQLFMLASPMEDNQSGLGRQHHLVARPITQQAVSPNTAPTNEFGVPRAPPAPQIPQAPQGPGQNAAAVQNAVRQAMLNHQRRGNNIEHAGLARHIRRIWLFTRLWLFCYLTSAPGTWRRYIFVGIALLVTFFSETDIPRQFATTIISPIQRHLEGLTHAGGPADRATQTVANDAAVEFNIWDQIRRAERALVFLFASLVPGLGERHVQARTAADQAFVAEQERQARERQEQEQARERERQEQERTQAGVTEGAGNAGTEGTEQE